MINTSSVLEPLVRGICSCKTELNILLFGSSNAGKSSLINTALPLVSKSLIRKKVAQVRLADDGDHTTVTLASYNLGKIKIWDTWGWDYNTDNYSLNDFQNILQGRVASGVSMVNGVTVEHEDIKRRFESVIFVVSPDMLEIPNYLERLGRFAKAAIEMNRFVAFAFTKMDTCIREFNIETDPKKASNCLCTSKEYKDAVKSVQSVIGDVAHFPIVNYQAESTNAREEKYEFLVATMFYNVIAEIEELRTSSGVVEVFDIFEGENVVLTQ